MNVEKLIIHSNGRNNTFPRKKIKFACRVLPRTCMTCARKKCAIWPHFLSSETDFLKNYPQTNLAFGEHKKIWIKLLKMKKSRLNQPRYPSCVFNAVQYISPIGEDRESDSDTVIVMWAACFWSPNKNKRKRSIGMKRGERKEGFRYSHSVYTNDEFCGEAR